MNETLTNIVKFCILSMLLWFTEVSHSHGMSTNDFSLLFIFNLECNSTRVPRHEWTCLRIPSWRLLGNTLFKAHCVQLTPNFPNQLFILAWWVCIHLLFIYNDFTQRSHLFCQMVLPFLLRTDTIIVLRFFDYLASAGSFWAQGLAVKIWVKHWILRFISLAEDKVRVIDDSVVVFKKELLASLMLNCLKKFIPVFHWCTFLNFLKVLSIGLVCQRMVKCILFIRFFVYYAAALVFKVQLVRLIQSGECHGFCFRVSWFNLKHFSEFFPFLGLFDLFFLITEVEIVFIVLVEH